MLYALAAKYIFSSNQTNNMVSKLSGTTKHLTSGLLQDPKKMENAISMVRTIAPLTTPQTVAKVNTYLPAIEKISTLLSMYSFISRAQNFRPIQTLDAKTPMDKITALMRTSNIPMGKLMAQPLLANNMDKIIGSLAMNMAKSGGFDEILSSFSKNNNDLNQMLSLFQENEDGGDIGNLLAALTPMLDSVSSENVEDHESEELQDSKDSYENPTYENTGQVFKTAEFNYDSDEVIEPEDKIQSHEKTKSEKKKERTYPQRPIRIRQRPR